jgi:hypothetical protein
MPLILPRLHMTYCQLLCGAAGPPRARVSLPSARVRRASRRRRFTRLPKITFAFRSSSRSIAQRSSTRGQALPHGGRDRASLSPIFVSRSTR